MHFELDGPAIEFTRHPENPFSGEVRPRPCASPTGTPGRPVRSNRWSENGLTTKAWPSRLQERTVT